LPLNYTGLTLIALGIGLLVSEMFVPSFGVLGVGGIIALAIGSLLLFDTESSDLIVDKKIVFTAVGTVGAIMLALSYLVFRTQQTKPTMGMNALIGEIGEVRSELAPAGKIFVHGEYWNAQADTPIAVATKVEVIGYDGMTLKVRRA
jgi:membrane-bound serine protease (ClpP class)